MFPLTDVVWRSDDLPDLLVLLDDPGHLQVAQLDLAVRKLAHQHDVLGLKRIYVETETETETETESETETETNKRLQSIDNIQ